MGEYLQKLSQPIDFRPLKDVAKRLDDFYKRHPAISTVKNLAKDYGDMVPAVAAGLALTQWGGIYGDYRWEVLGYGSLLSMLGVMIKSNEDVRVNSFMRNATAGAVPIIVGLDIRDNYHADTLANSITYESLAKILEFITIGGAFGFDSDRRKAVIKEKFKLKQMESEGSVENLHQNSS